MLPQSARPAPRSLFVLRGISVFPSSKQEVPGKERRTVKPKKGVLSSCQHCLGVEDLGRQMVKSAQEGVGKLIPMEMGFPRHEDGDRAGLRLQGAHVHPVQSDFLMPVASLLSAAQKPSVVAPRCL